MDNNKNANKIYFLIIITKKKERIYDNVLTKRIEPMNHTNGEPRRSRNDLRRRRYKGQQVRRVDDLPALSPSKWPFFPGHSIQTSTDAEPSPDVTLYT